MHSHTHMLVELSSSKSTQKWILIWGGEIMEINQLIWHGADCSVNWCDYFSLFVSSLFISFILALHRTCMHYNMHFYIINNSVIVVCVLQAIHCVLCMPALIDMWLLCLICQEEIKSYQIYNHEHKRSCDKVKQKKQNGKTAISQTIATSMLKWKRAEQLRWGHN